MKLPLVAQASFALSILAMSADPLAAEDKLFINEKFEVQKPEGKAPCGYEAANFGVTATYAYKAGAGVDGSCALVLTADFNASSENSLAAVLYQNGNVAGNDSVNRGEYFLEFEAKGSKSSREFKVILEGWVDRYYKGGSGGRLHTAFKLPETPDTFCTYRIALDDATWGGEFNPAGKTYQIAFQIFGKTWGDDVGNQLVIDNIKIGRTIPTP